jgi:hypothetical protein
MNTQFANKKYAFISLIDYMMKGARAAVQEYCFDPSRTVFSKGKLADATRGISKRKHRAAWHMTATRSSPRTDTAKGLTQSDVEFTRQMHTPRWHV